MPRPPRPRFLSVFSFFHTTSIFYLSSSVFPASFPPSRPIATVFPRRRFPPFAFAPMSPFGTGPEHSSDSVTLARLPRPELESHQARIWSGTFHICEDILAERFSGDIAACDQLNGGRTSPLGHSLYPKTSSRHKGSNHCLLLRRYHTRGSTVALEKKMFLFAFLPLLLLKKYRNVSC